MALKADSAAVSTARAHATAYSTQDWDAAKALLTPDVHVTVTNVQGNPPPVDTVRVEPYMEGLKAFASAIVPSRYKELSAAGDDHIALVTFQLDASFGPGMPPVTSCGARLYDITDDGKIRQEQVIFFIAG
jgi:hypothetical protein